MKQTIHVFDFDGTLTNRDSLLLFIRFVRGSRAFWLGLLRHMPLLLLMKLGLYDNGRCKERLFGHFFRGMEESQFEMWCERFAAQFGYILRPKGVAAIRQATADGQRVVVVSASIDRWVRPFFREEENTLLTVIGTEIEVADGVLTGRFATPNCYGAEKVRRLAEQIPDLAAQHLIAYGDSSGDKQLFRIADEAHYKPFRS